MILRETFLILKEQIKIWLSHLVKYNAFIILLYLSMESPKELVIKSNNLIDMQTDLSLIQLKVFTKIIMCTVKNPNAEFYRFSIKELLKDFHIQSKHHTALKKATAGMIKAVILKEKDGEVQLALFTKVVYDKGIVDMYLHPDLKPYILDIKERYTKYFFQSITGLNSMYSMRIYELLKQYEFRNSRSFELEELRFLLNIWDSKYLKYTDFKKRVIIQAQKELQEKTDIAFDFEEIRERRKVVRIDFKINSNYKQESKPIKTVLNTSKTVWKNSLYTILETKLFLSSIQIKTVLKQYNQEYIKRNIDYTLAQKNIKNIAWYFLKALEKDFWQTLFLQQKQKEDIQKIKNKKLQQEQNQKKLEQENQKIKHEKIQDFIKNREEEVLEIIPNFIKANKFILQKLDIDLENTKELLEIIKWENTKVKGVRKLFMGFISHKFK